MLKDDIKINILVIEDNPGDFVLIEDYLNEHFRIPIITHAESFQEAVQTLNSTDHTFDVILLDLTLPDKSGETLIQNIIHQADNIPVIALTGYADLSFSIRSISMGITDYLVKDDLNPLALYKSILYGMERKVFQKKLTDSERRYKNLFHVSPQPLYLYDCRTMEFLDVNMACCKFYGYSRDQFLGMILLDLIPPDEKEAVKSAILKNPEYPESTALGIRRHRRKDGSEVQMDIRISDVDHDGRPARLVLAVDVTERQKHILEIEEKNKKLQEIAWIQSHVVRAPLTRMMGLIQIMDEEDTGELSRDEIIKNIKSSSLEIDNIIRDISKKSESVRTDK